MLSSGRSPVDMFFTVERLIDAQASVLDKRTKLVRNRAFCEEVTRLATVLKACPIVGLGLG